MILGNFQVPPNDKNALAALWGKLASEILMQDWDTALDDLNRLKDVIDAGVSWSILCACSAVVYLFDSLL